MNTKDVLIAARTIIERPQWWAQGAGALDIRECGTSADSPDAVSWCALSACWLVLRSPHFGAMQALADQVPRGFDNLVSAFNDNPATTHADVLALFDRAIAACEEE